MKKFTLLLTALIAVSMITVAQIKMYLHLEDGTRVEYIASRVDSITFDSQIVEPDDSDKPEEKPGANAHEYVDLGLPSGTKWATCNVGADYPEDYGDYFAWGETEPKEEYDLSTYKWHEGSYYTHTKYCTSSTYGKVDNKTTLDLADDAANANWGGNWRMPTKTEQDELRTECTWTWTTQNGVKGYIVTSKSNGNSIFLPAAGYRDFSDLWDAGFNGYYSSSSLYKDDSGGACRLYFESSYVSSGSYSLRRRGWSVRPVLAE